MRYFAEIKDNIVQRVIVADSQEWCEKKLGGKWVETFMYNKDKNYAGKGYIYYPSKDNFSSPKPYKSWKLKEDCKWEAPKPMPEETLAIDGKRNIWNEKILNWEKK